METCDIQVEALSGDVDLFSLFLTQLPDPRATAAALRAPTTLLHTTQHTSLLVPFGFEQGVVYGGTGPWPMSEAHGGSAFWGQPYASEQPFHQRLVSLPSPSKQTAGATPSTTGRTASTTGVTAAPPHCPPGR